MLGDSLLGVARLAGELLVDGRGVAKEGGIAGLQVDGDGDVVGVVHRPALDELQAGLHCHAGRLEVKVRVSKCLVACTSSHMSSTLGHSVTPLVDHLCHVTEDEHWGCLKPFNAQLSPKSAFRSA